MSAQASLAGLFPPATEDERWNEEIYWQPIPVHTMPIELDILLHGGKPCPKYYVLYDYYMKKSPEAIEIMTKYEDQIAYWSKMSEWNIETVSDVTILYKKFMTDKDKNNRLVNQINLYAHINLMCNGNVIFHSRLPEWAEEAIKPDGAMERITRVTHKLRGTPELVRRRSRFLIKEILERSAQKINSTLNPDQALWIYSGHSSTLATMLNGLKIFEVD